KEHSSENGWFCWRNMGWNKESCDHVIEGKDMQAEACTPMRFAFLSLFRLYLHLLLSLYLRSRGSVVANGFEIECQLKKRRRCVAYLLSTYPRQCELEISVFGTRLMTPAERPDAMSGGICMGKPEIHDFTIPIEGTECKSQ